MQSIEYPKISKEDLNDPDKLYTYIKELEKIIEDVTVSSRILENLSEDGKIGN